MIFLVQRCAKCIWTPFKGCRLGYCKLHEAVFGQALARPLPQVPERPGQDRMQLADANELNVIRSFQFDTPRGQCPYDVSLEGPGVA